jgi:hypothetical protein
MLALTLTARAQAEDIPAAAVTESDQVWNTRCSLCHGAGGKGDGPASAPLTPKPRDMTDKKWQTSVDDKHIEIVIVKGGPAVNLSPMMAANPDLEAKPDVVRALRAKVRSLGAK